MGVHYKKVSHHTFGPTFRKLGLHAHVTVPALRLHSGMVPISCAEACSVHVALEHSHIHVIGCLFHKYFTVEQEVYRKVAFAIIHVHTFPYIYTHDTTDVSDAYVYDAYV